MSSEERFKATTPDGRISVEVFLQEDNFEGKVIINGVVTDELKTPHQGQLLSWAQRQMKEAMRRSEK